MISAARWQRIQELFAEAGTLDPAQQPAWLATACGDDRELRDVVAALLAAHHAPDAIVDRAAVDYLPRHGIEELAERWIGRRVGAYELTSLIGSGGMGEVYRARRADDEFQKEVAIKLVRAGFDTRYVLERFRAERQILANLDHPNIARLIDGGATPEGLPFVVMELVEGSPIDEYCESRALPLRERLDLFREVCAAVSFAHQRLVVHRDLKPSNILVTRDGMVKLVDFGIAKIIDASPEAVATGATRTAISLMTPAFSSPEQILGLPVTTASDVYSLGVVLFHLLTGRSPYRRTFSSTRDAIREVCETEPIRPSESAALELENERAVPPRDLDDITLKALRKEPEQRYGSVEQLSADIGRFLQGLPVLAHEGQLGYRWGKFLGRHRAWLAASVLIAIALMTATVVSWREARIAQRESVRAERNFTRVRELANSLLFEVHDSIANLPGAMPTRKLLLTRAREYLDGLARDNPADDALEREMAIAWRRLGTLEGGLGTQSFGDSRAALEDQRKSVSLLTALSATHPNDRDLALELGSSLRQLGLAQDYGGDHAGSMESDRHAQALAIRLHSTAPKDPRFGHLLAVVDADLCGFSDMQHLDEALRLCRDAVAVQEEVVRLNPVREERRDMSVIYQRLSAEIANGVFNTGAHPDLLPESVALMRKVIDIDTALVAEFPAEAASKRDLLVDRVQLAVSLFMSGDVTGAIDQCHQGIALSDAELARDPDNVAMRIDAAIFRRYLGYAEVASGDATGAVRDLEDSVARFQPLTAAQLSPSTQLERAAAYSTLGQAHALLAAQLEKARKPALAEWRSADAAFETSAASFEDLKSRAAFDGHYANYYHDATNGRTGSGAALARLGHAGAGSPSSR